MILIAKGKIMVPIKDTVDPGEINKFTKIATQWWKEDGAFSELHKINPIRIRYIIDKIKEYFLDKEKNQIKLLDVGCGGGIASMPFARLGFEVTGIDAGKENIEEATNYAKAKRLDIKFFYETAEDHVRLNIKYDVIICLEMVEHVANLALLLNSLKQMLNKDGIIIISTINRTFKAKFLAIWLAENVLGMIPENTHNFDKFVKPSEISTHFENTGYRIKEIIGMEFDLLKREWVISNNIDVNYLCLIS
jgi:2-polyprenyl-6-hydroxyphenyl methylase/3-demethylubiquinone-9 3-methyltransferase